MNTWVLAATGAVSALPMVAAMVRNRVLSGRLRAAEFEARHDVLTGLLNRRGFHEAARDLLDSQLGPVLLVAGDVDLFKHVNDTFGHDAGDQVLQTITDRITDVLPREAVFARLGGDEFVILLALSDRGPKVLLDRVRAAVRQPINVLVNHVSEHIAVGVSLGGLVIEADALVGEQALPAGMHLADSLALQAKSSTTGRPVLEWALDSPHVPSLLIKRPLVRQRDLPRNHLSLAGGEH